MSATTQIVLVNVARKALEESEGNHGDAVALMAKWGHEDPDLYSTLMDEEAYLSRVRQVIRDAAHSDRRSIRIAGTPVLRRRGSDNSGVLNGEDLETYRAGVMLAFRLPSPGGGRSLAKATLVDLEWAESYYAKHKHAYARSLLFVQKVKAMVKKGQFVEDVLTDDAVLELLAEADKEAVL